MTKKTFTRLSPSVMEHMTLLGIRLGEQCLTKVTISCYKWLQPTMAKVVIVQDCGIGRILVTHFTIRLNLLFLMILFTNVNIFGSSTFTNSGPENGFSPLCVFK